MATPIAIPGINSTYDDFNSYNMALAYRNAIVFSTNRGSLGNNYDLYDATVRWSYPRAGEVTPVRATDVKPFLPSLMSDGDERGPIVLDKHVGRYPRIVFASNRSGGAGGLDLYGAECKGNDCEHPVLLRPLGGLNSSADDAYLSAEFDDGQNLFASNRDAKDGTNDIYRAQWWPGDSIDNSPDVDRMDALSSSADDTAPYVYDFAEWDAKERQVEVVFVSSRAGGLGEHDLYCARYEVPPSDMRDGVEYRHTQRVWSKPVHLRAFSSPRDEYRPIIVHVAGAHFMIFSSTRDGGQGGYDLYVVGYSGCPRA
jgi:hypothetical protein